jgi:GTPase SAR1 family protein
MVQTVASIDFVTRLQLIRERIVAEHGTDPAGLRSAELLDRIAKRLARPPRFAVLGEVNSGKTSLTNALIGEDLLTTDVIHNSRVPVLLRYAETPIVQLRRGDGVVVPIDAASLGAVAEHEGLVEVGVPLPCLKEFELIDTPGTTATEDQMERSLAVARTTHAVIWCTIGTQAWKASEVACVRALGNRASGYGVLAVTHADLLDATDQLKVRQRLESEIIGEYFPALALVGLVEGASREGADSASCAGLLEIATAARTAAGRVQRERERIAAVMISRFAERLADVAEGGARPAEASEPAPVLLAAE